MKLSPGLQQSVSTAEPTACLALEIEGTASVIIKAPDEDIAYWKEDQSIGYQMALAKMALGAVIVFKITIYDKRSGRYEADAVFNEADEGDRKLLQKFAKQSVFTIHFFNSMNHYEFSKRVNLRAVNRRELLDLIKWAHEYNAAIPKVDFSRAKNEYFNMTAIGFQ